MTIKIDYRTGLMKAPSASGVERIMLCPGSWTLEKDLPNQDNEFSNFGSRVHAVLAGEVIDDLTDEELRSLNDMVERRGRLFDALGINNDWKITTEERLTMNRGLQVIVSGQYDGLAISPDGKLAVIFDYKSLPGKVTNTAENMQMRTLAMLVKENYPEVERVIVHIIQAYTPDHAPVIYDAESLSMARAQVLKILEAAEQPDAPLNPGPVQCKYCKARAFCPALVKTLTDTNDALHVGKEEEETIDKKEITERVGQLTGTQLAETFRKIKLAKLLIEAVEDETFRRLCADPEAIPGLKLEIDKPRVSEAEKLWQRAWLERNGLIGDNGKAKRGAAKQAEAAWKEVSEELIKTTTYERQSWRDVNQAAAVLQAGMTPEQYRKVAGKVVLAD